MTRSLVFLFIVIGIVFEASTNLRLAIAQDAKPRAIRLAGGRLLLTAPDTWTPKRPKFAGIVDYEFAVSPAEGDKAGGRVIVGGAGGGLEANKRRWLAQYSQPDGSRTEDRAKSKERKVGDISVTTMDVSGTYQAPPFDPAGGGPRKNYRMLVGVIEAGKLGSYYIKFYGPARTVAANEETFHKMMKSVRTSD